MYTPTPSLVKELREGFSAEKCATTLLDVVTTLLGAIGVRVQTKIVHIDEDAKVDVSKVAGCVNDLTAVMSAIMAGSRVNVFQMWEDKNVSKPKSR